MTSKADSSRAVRNKQSLSVPLSAVGSQMNWVSVSFAAQLVKDAPPFSHCWAVCSLGSETFMRITGKLKKGVERIVGVS